MKRNRKPSKTRRGRPTPPPTIDPRRTAAQRLFVQHGGWVLVVAFVAIIFGAPAMAIVIYKGW